ncbi:MAG: hypothetical protein ACI9N9_001957 [Enterobacterales bacterium]|jgi:hypothetical protein
MLFTTRLRQSASIICFTLFFTIATASAADSKQLEQEVKGQLRKADSYMSNGDYADAKIWLQDAAETIKTLETVDPDNSKVETFKSKIDGMVDGLRRSTGEEVDLWGSDGTAVATSVPTTTTTANAEEPQAATSSSSPKKLPYAARQEMELLETQFRNIESSYGFLGTYDVTSTNTNQLLEDIPELIDGLQPLLDQAKKVAANESVTAHADFDAAQVRIDEQPGRFEATRNDIIAKRDGEEAVTAAMQPDADHLISEYERLDKKYFRQAKGTAIYANDLPPIEHLLVLIEDFENNEKAGAEVLLNDFSAKYGSTKSEIDQAAKSAKLNQDIQLGYAYTEIRDGIANVTNTRQAEYDEIIKKITRAAGTLTDLSDFYRLQAHSDYREWMAVAGQFAIDKADAQKQSGYLENILNSDKKVFLEGIESVTWPGSTDDDNSEAALKYFRESDNWGKDPTGVMTPIGIRVEGEWSVQKRDRLNSPTRYGIPAQAAFQMEADKAQGLARVFTFTMLARESTDPQQSPPFVSVSVGDSWYIKADKVK